MTPLMVSLLAAANLCAQPRALDRAACELDRIEPERALALLTQARAQEPYSFADYVRLHELLGVTHAYLGDTSRALAAFETLLALEPGHVISYGLSPQVTLVFEAARRAVATRSPPEVQVLWPGSVRTIDPLPIDIQVLADPLRAMRRALVTVARPQTREVRRHSLDLEAGGSQHLVVPPLDPVASGPEELALSIRFLDDRGNEIYLFGSEDRPRRIALAFEPVVPWYRQWWVWAGVGFVAAGVTGATVYVATRADPPLASGTFSVKR